MVICSWSGHALCPYMVIWPIGHVSKVTTYNEGKVMEYCTLMVMI